MAMLEYARGKGWRVSVADNKSSWRAQVRDGGFSYDETFTIPMSQLSLSAIASNLHNIARMDKPELVQEVDSFVQWVQSGWMAGNQPDADLMEIERW